MYTTFNHIYPKPGKSPEMSRDEWTQVNIDTYQEPYVYKRIQSVVVEKRKDGNPKETVIFSNEPIRRQRCPLTSPQLWEFSLGVCHRLPFLRYLVTGTEGSEEVLLVNHHTGSTNGLPGIVLTRGHRVSSLK